MPRADGKPTIDNDSEKWNREDMQRLVEWLARPIDSVGVFTLDRLMMECRECGVFEWRLSANAFKTIQNRSWFGKMLPRYCGPFNLPDSRRVELRRVGTDHSRCFMVKIL